MEIQLTDDYRITGEPRNIVLERWVSPDRLTPRQTHAPEVDSRV